jgi:hypothetical protein
MYGAHMSDTNSRTLSLTLDMTWDNKAIDDIPVQKLRAAFCMVVIKTMRAIVSADAYGATADKSVWRGTVADEGLLGPVTYTWTATSPDFGDEPDVSG